MQIPPKYSAKCVNGKKGYDLVFVARGKTPFVKSQVVEKAMKQHLKQAGVLKEK